MLIQSSFQKTSKLNKYDANVKIFIIFFNIFACIVFNKEALATDELILPKPTGLYSVGTQAIELRDSARRLMRGKEPRRWMAQIYYPSELHKDKYPYMPNTIKDGMVEGAKVITFAKPNATPITTRLFPLIIAIPGRGGERQKGTIVYEELASHGYIVLAMDQPYVANFVKFPNGQKITLALKDAWQVQKNRDYRYKYDDEVINGAISDIVYVLENLNEIEVIGKACNHLNIILMGHSLGANVAHIMGFQDPRIKAVIDIDSKITDRAVYGHIGVPPNLHGKPVLFIRAALQYQEDVGNHLTKISNATIWSPAVQHSAFIDDAYFASKNKFFGKKSNFGRLFNWLCKREPYWTNVDTNLGEKDVDEWFYEYRSYLVKWLEMHIS